MFPGGRSKYEEALKSNVNKGVHVKLQSNPKERFEGKPGQVIATSHGKGNELYLTEIGDNGKVVRERHLTDHKVPGHSNPHDHAYTWNDETGKPVRGKRTNYPNGGAPKLGKARKK